MAITHVQSVINNNWTASSPGTVTISGVTAGDSLILHFAMLTSTSGPIATGVTDTNGNTWVNIAQTNANGYASQDNEIWWVQSANAGNTTITVNFTGTPYASTDTQVEVIEFSGIGGLDGVASISTGTSASFTGTTGTPSQSGDLALIVGICPLTGGFSSEPASPWTNENSSSSCTSDPAWQVLTNTSPASATWTVYTSLAYATIQVLFAPLSPKITITDSFPTAYGTNQSTLSVTNTNIGDLRLISVKINDPTNTVSSVTSTGIPIWARYFAYTDTARTGRYEIWGGVIHTTGTDTVNITYNATPGVACELFSSELHYTVSTPSSWVVTTGGEVIFTGSSTAVSWPSLLTDSNGSTGTLAYWGACRVGQVASAGSTTGFTYSTVNGNGDLALFNGTLSFNTSYAPTAAQSPAAAYSTWGVIVQANSVDPLINEVSGFPVNNEATGVNTLAVTTQKVGDLLVLATQIHSTSNPITLVSGGNVSNWQRAYQYIDTVNNVITEEIWWGTIIASGTNTINVTWSGSISALSPELVADSFTTNYPATWGLISASGNAAASTTNVTFPNLISNNTLNPQLTSNNPQLYWGYSEETTTATPGTTSGFTYSLTAQGNIFLYNKPLSPDTSYAPTGTQATGNNTCIAAIFMATPGNSINVVDNYPMASATSQSTLGVTNSTIGDYRVLGILAESSTIYPTTVSGGGVGSWSLIANYEQSSGHVGSYSLWGGVITATGSQTIGVAYSATGSYNVLTSNELNWTGGAPGQWEVVGSGFITDTTTGVSSLYPSISTNNSPYQVYWAISRPAGNSLSGGDDPGFIYSPAGTIYPVATNGVLATNSSYSTSSPQTSAGGYASWGVVLAVVPTIHALAIVADQGANSVDVIDLSSNTVIETITVGTTPYGVTIAPNGQYAYIANNGSNSISVVSTLTYTVVNTITVGTTPYFTVFTPDGSIAYVTNNGTNTVSVINTATMAVTSSITVGTNPTGAAITPNGSYVYVAAWVSNNVSVIDTSSNTVAYTITVGTNPTGAAITPDGSYVYVANGGSNNVSVISTSSNTVTTTVSVGNSPRGVGVTPDGAYVYVMNKGANTVSIISTATNTVVATVTVGTAPYEVAFSPDGQFAYITNANSASISVISTATMAVTSSITVGTTPVGIASWQPLLLNTPDTNIGFPYVTQDYYYYPGVNPKSSFTPIVYTRTSTVSVIQIDKLTKQPNKIVKIVQIDSIKDAKSVGKNTKTTQVDNITLSKNVGKSAKVVQVNSTITKRIVSHIRKLTIVLVSTVKNNKSLAKLVKTTEVNTSRISKTKNTDVRITEIQNSKVNKTINKLVKSTFIESTLISKSKRAILRALGVFIVKSNKELVKNIKAAEVSTNKFSKFKSTNIKAIRTLTSRINKVKSTSIKSTQIFSDFIVKGNNVYNKIINVVQVGLSRLTKSKISSIKVVSNPVTRINKIKSTAFKGIQISTIKQVKQKSTLFRATQINISNMFRSGNITRLITVVQIRLSKLNKQKNSNIKVTEINSVRQTKQKTSILRAVQTWIAGEYRKDYIVRVVKALAASPVRLVKSVSKSSRVSFTNIIQIVRPRNFNRTNTAAQIVSASVTRATSRKRNITSGITYTIGTSRTITLLRQIKATALMLINNRKLIQKNTSILNINIGNIIHNKVWKYLIQIITKITSFNSQIIQRPNYGRPDPDNWDPNMTDTSSPGVEGLVDTEPEDFSFNE